MRTLLGLGLLAVGWLMGWQLFAPERLPAENLVQLRKQLLAMPAPGYNPEVRLAFVPDSASAAGPADETVSRRALASGYSTHPRNGNARIEVAGIATDQPAPAARIAATAQTRPTPAPDPVLAPGAATPSQSSFEAGYEQGSGLAREVAERALWGSIQSELKRVGCYNGSADGAWGEESRQALLRFAAIKGASLDPRRPDVASLALLRSHKGTACGNFDRRLKTRIAGSSSGAPAGSSTESGLLNGPALARSGSAPAPLAGRMAVGGPPLEHIEARSLRSPFESANDRRPTPPDYVAAAPSPAAYPEGESREFGALLHDSMVAPQPEDAAAAARSSERKRRASKERRSKEARQRALMRQAFGDNF